MNRIPVYFCNHLSVIPRYFVLPRFIVSVEGVTLGKCLIGVSTEGRYIISPPTESFLLLTYRSCRKSPSAIGAVTTEVANDDFAKRISHFYAAYIRIYDNNSSVSSEWKRHFRTVYRGVVGK